VVQRVVIKALVEAGRPLPRSPAAEVAVGHAGEHFDGNGRLSEPNLEQEVHEVIAILLDEAQAAKAGQAWSGALST
jgi:hypothetical protein